MRIELDKLEGSHTRFSHLYEPGEFALDEEGVRLTEPPEVQGSLTRSAHEVRLQGTLRARAEVDCDRCLKTVEVPVETKFEAKYVRADDYRATETAELQEDDLSFSVLQEEAVDIDELVREQLLLALPSRALCTDECKGLCPACGANLNAHPCACEKSVTDPRWDALKGLANRKS